MPQRQIEQHTETIAAFVPAANQQQTHQSTSQTPGSIPRTQYPQQSTQTTIPTTQATTQGMSFSVQIIHCPNKGNKRGL
jgi:hypothetical protein